MRWKFRKRDFIRSRLPNFDAEGKMTFAFVEQWELGQ